NVDYNGIEDSLKKDEGGNINLDLYFFSTTQEEDLGIGDSMVDDNGDWSSLRNSSAVLRR
ncbi:Hypothetical predicted protein, partial [Olea europaea subsp. europaea]